MTVTAKQIKTIRAELKKQKPKRLNLNSDRPLTNKESVTALATDIEAMKRQGFTTAELVEILKKQNIHVTGATLNRYLHEARQIKKASKTINSTERPLSTQEPAIDH